MAESVIFAFISHTSLYFTITHRCFDVNVFQNWVVMEYQLMGSMLTHVESFILCVGAKMFTIAGPVIVYGVSASVVYGLLYWIMILF